MPAYAPQARRNKQFAVLLSLLCLAPRRLLSIGLDFDEEGNESEEYSSIVTESESGLDRCPCQPHRHANNEYPGSLRT